MASVSPNRTYRLDPAAYERVTKPALYRRFGIFLALTVILGAGMLGFMAIKDPAIVSSLPYSLPLVAIVLAASTVRSVRSQLVKQRLSWDSYELTLGPSLLVRRVGSLQPLEILRAEVTRIAHAPGRGITVSTKDRHRTIFVPEPLVGFDEVKERLAEWRTSEPARSETVPAVARSALMLGCFFASLLVPDVRLAVVAAVVFYALLGAAALEVVRTKTLEESARRRVLISFALFAVAPAARLLMHLSGQAGGP